MRVVEVRRYPVKSMAGELLDEVDLDPRGLVGDRWWAVVDADGKLSSGKNSRRFRRRDAVFSYRAATDVDGVRVHGDAGSWPVGDPALDHELSRAMRAPVSVLPEAATPHQDAGSVSLVGSASLAWCREHLGVDGESRRIRPNLVVETDEAFVEETWAGSSLRIGEVELVVQRRIQRCRMIDVAQDGLPVQPGWLKALARERQLSLGVYADVVRAGAIRCGDDVEVLLRPPDPS